MTVNEFFETYCKSRLKIMSGYNGKVLCKAFNPKKHIEIGRREITHIWAEIEATKAMAFSNISLPILCAYVHGRVEYEKEHNTDSTGKKGAE